MNTSRVVVKIVVRLFFLLFAIAVVPPFLMGQQGKLKGIYLSFHHKWEIIFPVILILTFIALLIIGAVKKFKETDLNWLLVLSTVILTIYGIAIYIRVLHLMGS